MPKRIPHSDLEVITGEQTTEDYLEMQKKMGRFYLGGFLKILMQQGKTGRFLEIGPGPGYQTAEVAERNPQAEIVALEPSADMIAVAESYIDRRGFSARVSFVEGSVEDGALLQSLGQFDLVYSTFSLHHWQDPVVGIRNLYETITDDGVILLFDFERHWLTYYLPVKRGLHQSIMASYTPAEIRAMAAGLDGGTCEVRRRFPYLSVLMSRE